MMHFGDMVVLVLFLLLNLLAALVGTAAVVLVLVHLVFVS
jgi:hypothetical protein